MKLITQHELDALTHAELHTLDQILCQLLVQTAPGSPERRNCLASLENVRRSMNRHDPQPSAPKPGL
ncbi:MAG: hypothetical protein CO093_00260 [Alphaproteobacteria bacterium CG_4_9_14_3_um_filter_47_13]|nr:MAG: hypothetical protein CO093_00260 [Alphaproteobacteria bacterium CG_4_9_14_3_um_filter_47_13]